MTKQHFDALARVMLNNRPEPEGFYDPMHRKDYEYDLWAQIVRDLADVCYEFNGQFDRMRFYRVCGLIEAKDRVNG